MERHQAKEILEKAFPNGVDLGHVCYRESLADRADMICAIFEKDYDKLDQINYRYHDQRMQTISEIIEKHFSYLSESEMERDGLQDHIRDWLEEHNTLDPIKQLAKNTGDVRVRIEMTSNYDCGMSDFLHGGIYFYESSFFGSAIRWLGMDPRTVKYILQDIGHDCNGTWPRRKSKGYIDPQEFLNEHAETTAWRLPCFAVTIPLVDIYNADDISKITIKEWTPFGLMNDRVGTCSMFDATLKKDMTIDLSHNDKSDWSISRLFKYDDNGYGLDDVAGMSHEFWQSGKAEIL